jgi:Domain of unknown function (DUF4105)
MVYKEKTNNIPAPSRSTPLPIWLRVPRAIGITGWRVLLALLTVWAAAALFVDCRIPVLRLPLALIYVLAAITVFVKFRRSRWAAVAYVSGFCVVLAWWLTLKPTNTANWQPDVDRTASAEITGDRITIHNLRNCNYRSETEYSDCWSDRTLDLSQIRAADLFLTNWGIPFASHPIVSFQFGDDQHVAFSIEARYKVGQAYSTVLGCFRQYELIFVTADERDVIRLRTNYRKDEEVYMYRLQATPEVARAMLLTYVDYLNKLNDHPEWYNEVTRNCTTTINGQLGADVHSKQPWNYRYLLNGTLDELLYDRGRLVTGGLTFPELKQREHINTAGKAAGLSPDYSALIRKGRIGF